MKAVNYQIEMLNVGSADAFIIYFIDENNTGHLVLGDAGRESYNNIPHLLRNQVKGVSWLKVPHHGSKHNMDSTMINWIKPKTAYISTKGIGNFLNQCTVNALKRSGCSVYSTHKENSSFLHKGIWDRDGYSTRTISNRKSGNGFLVCSFCIFSY